MARKAESLFQDKVKRYLKSLDRCWFVKVQQVSINGTPDILCCINGFFVALELKASSKGRLSKLQDWNLNHISKANGMAYVAYPENWDNIKNKLQILSIIGGVNEINV